MRYSNSFFSVISSCILIIILLSPTNSMLAEGYEFYVSPLKYRVLNMSKSTAGVCGVYNVNNYRVANIPDNVDYVNHNFKVTEILADAFKEQHDIYMSFIPSSIEHIRNYAFFGTGVEARDYNSHNYGQYCLHKQKNGCGISYNAINCELDGDKIFSYQYELYHYEKLVFSLFHIGPDVEVLPSNLPQYEINGNLFIPDNVKTIKEGALQGTQNAVVIGKNVAEIKAEAFSNCSVIYSSAHEPPVCYENSFGTRIDTLFVPQGSIDKYEAADYWKSATKIIEREYVAAQSFSFVEDTIFRDIDDPFIPEYNILPAHTTSKKISWISTDPKVATVSADGIITPHAFGETDIYASIDSLMAKCHVVFNATYVDTAYLVRYENANYIPLNDSITRNIDHNDTWYNIYLNVSPVRSQYFRISTNAPYSPYYHSGIDTESSNPPYYCLYVPTYNQPCVNTIVAEVKQYKDLHDYVNYKSTFVTPIKVFTDSVTIIYTSDPEFYDTIVFIDVNSPLVVPVGTEETLSVYGLPANSKNKEVSWSVTQDSPGVIMYYVKNKMLKFTAMNEGVATVTAYATKNPSARAECKIIVSNDEDAIEIIDVDSLDGYVDVYNMQGKLLRHQVLRASATQGLPPGIYIVGHDKVIVR